MLTLKLSHQLEEGVRVTRPYMYLDLRMSGHLSVRFLVDLLPP